MDKLSWQKIMEHLETLPSAQKNIASYMLSNKEKSIFMTAAELGYNAGSSEASAIRLASTLGYANFPDFIKSLQLEAQSQLSTIGRLQLHKLLPDEGGYVAGVIARDLELAKYYLKANGDNDKALKLLAAEICEAGAVYLIGLRSTRCLVQYMEYYLSWFFPKIFIPSYENLGNYLTAAPKNSLTLGISFPRYTRQTVECIAFAKSNGFKTAAITDSMNSPLAREADMAVIAPCSHIAHIDSLLIPIGLINALLIQVAEYMGPTALRRLGELEEIWEMRDIYC